MKQADSLRILQACREGVCDEIARAASAGQGSESRRLRAALGVLDAAIGHLVGLRISSVERLHQIF